MTNSSSPGGPADRIPPLSGMQPGRPPTVPEVAPVDDGGDSLGRSPRRWYWKDRLLLLPVALLALCAVLVPIDNVVARTVMGGAFIAGGVTATGALVVRRRPTLPGVPWDWSDLLAFIPLAGVIFFAGLVLLTTNYHPANAANDALFNVLGQAAFDGAGLAGVLILVLGRRRATPAELGLRMPRWRMLAAYPGFFMAAYVVVALLLAVSQMLVPNATSDQCQQVKASFGTNYGLAFIAVAVAAPIAEEIFFRGFLFGWLRAHAPLWAAALISGLAFGAVHGQGALFLALSGVGVVLALVYDRSASLYPGMLTHATFNAINLYVILYQPC